jgi:hypothetical protein
MNSSKRPEISTPYDFVHLTHISFDPLTGTFKGLPKEWQQLLQESDLNPSRSELEKNSQAVMEIVKFYQEGQVDVFGTKSTQSSIAASKDVTVRRRERNHEIKEVDIVKRLQAICTDADPTRLYRNLVKIGQGSVVSNSLTGTVY